MKKILVSLVMLAAVASFGANKKVVFIAGNPSHGPGNHEHRAGCLLFQKCLDKVGGIPSVVYTNGWPKEANAFDGADAVVIYSDGGDGHPAIKPDRLEVLGELMKKGVGFERSITPWKCPKTREGRNCWPGAAVTLKPSTRSNPTWVADYTKFPEHPIARGLKPFKYRDEWYYHMRFRKG